MLQSRSRAHCPKWAIGNCRVAATNSGTGAGCTMPRHSVDGCHYNTVTAQMDPLTSAAIPTDDPFHKVKVEAGKA